MNGGKHEFGANELNTPRTFYVRGLRGSDKMRDIKLTLEVENPPPGVECGEDTANLTCLWVDKADVRTGGKVSADAPAAARNWIEEIRVSRANVRPTNFPVAEPRTLGFGFFKDRKPGKRDVTRLGYLVECKAKTKPSDFDPEDWREVLDQDALGLQRDVGFIDWSQHPGADRWVRSQEGVASKVIPFPAPEEAGHLANDSNPPGHRVMKASSAGFIYDYDAPGAPGSGRVYINQKIKRGEVGEGTVRAVTATFRTFAAVALHGKVTRCSPVAYWDLRMMVRKHGAGEYEWELVRGYRDMNRLHVGQPARRVYVLDR